jgi:hypothetical protein
MDVIERSLGKNLSSSFLCVELSLVIWSDRCYNKDDNDDFEASNFDVFRKSIFSRVRPLGFRSHFHEDHFNSAIQLMLQTLSFEVLFLVCC